MKASSLLASILPASPKEKESFFLSIENQGFFLTWNSEDSTVFQKSMVNMLQTGHKGENEAPNLKIIWLRQHQQMRLIFSNEWRELKSLTKTNMKWTGRKVTSTVKCALWALSRRKGPSIFSIKKEDMTIICDQRKR